MRMLNEATFCLFIDLIHMAGFCDEYARWTSEKRVPSMTINELADHFAALGDPLGRKSVIKDKSPGPMVNIPMIDLYTLYLAQPSRQFFTFKNFCKHYKFVVRFLKETGNTADRRPQQQNL